MEMYPDLDYASLKQMVEGQNSGKEGISDYYSYWWTDPEQPRVRKISAYSPVKLQDSFWSVSAVIDYDDLYEPIAEGFLKMIFVFCRNLVIGWCFGFHTLASDEGYAKSGKRNR